MTLQPNFEGHFADPFVLKLHDGTYVAYGSSGSPVGGDHAFEALLSSDLVTWTSCGTVLERLDASFGDEYWAPEVAYVDGVFWMYYSVGHGIHGHHIRVARSDSPVGPFIDQGLNLTPDERFAIDAHPFLDDDGKWYLFFSRDVLLAKRPGTHLAVAPLLNMVALATPSTPVLEPNADWQIYERNREMYGSIFDWHTLEGASVVLRHGIYWLTYSGGAWTGPGYAVLWGTANSPLGPWKHAPEGSAPLLVSSDGLIGPGHNSLTQTPEGDDAIAFHSWNEEHTARKLHVHRIAFEPDGPRVGGPI